MAYEENTKDNNNIIDAFFIPIVYPMKINVRSNVSGKTNTFLLTKNMLSYYSAGDKGDTATTTTTTSGGAGGPNDFPYITKDILYAKYIKHKVDRMKKEEWMEILFNKDAFLDFIQNIVLKKEIKKPTENEQTANAEENMKMTIQWLFPTVYPTYNNYHETYKEKILNEGFGLSIQQIFFRKNYITYLDYEGATYSVVKTTVINDLINNPRYNELVMDYMKYQFWIRDIKNNGKIDNLLETRYNDIIRFIERNAKIFKTNNTNDTALQKEIKKIDVKLSGMEFRYSSSSLDFAKSKEDLTVYTELLGKIHKFVVLPPPSIPTADVVIPFMMDILNDYKKIKETSLNFVDTSIKKVVDNFMSFIGKYYYVSYINNTYIKHENINYNYKKEEDEEVIRELNDNLLFRDYTNFIRKIENYLPPTRRADNDELQTVIEKYTNFSSHGAGNGTGDKEENIALFKKIMNTKYLCQNSTNKCDFSGITDYLKINYCQVLSDDGGNSVKGTDQQDDTTATQNRMFMEIFVQLELVKGKLTSYQSSTASCRYKNELLGTELKTLVDTFHSTVLLNNPQYVIDVKTMMEGNPALAPAPAPAPAPAKTKGGRGSDKKGRRRTYKRRRTATTKARYHKKTCRGCGGRTRTRR